MRVTTLFVDGTGREVGIEEHPEVGADDREYGRRPI